MFSEESNLRFILLRACSAGWRDDRSRLGPRKGCGGLENSLEKPIFLDRRDEGVCAQKQLRNRHRPAVENVKRQRC